MPISRINPLFTANPTVQPSDQTTPALTAPKSPTGELMQRGFCRDIPVWYCPSTRIVLPISN